ncbi:TPA_asm: penton [Coelastrella green algae MELD virus]|nr:TPA_asm: penton [Coelastrella green algae MELD virus]
MKTLRTFFLHVSSAQRDRGTPWQFEVSIPDSVLHSEDANEIFKVTLLNFDTPFNWHTVEAGCNTIQIDGGYYKLPGGNYTYQQLARELSAVYPGLKCSYLQPQCKLQLVLPESHQVCFPDKLARVAGFDQGVVYTGTQLASVRPMQPLADTHIVVNVNLPQFNSLASSSTGDLSASSILAEIPVDAAPFQMIQYRCPNEPCSVYTSDTKLNLLCFSMNNRQGELLTYLGESHLTLQVEVLELRDKQFDELCERVDQIKAQLDRLLLYKAVKLAPA